MQVRAATHNKQLQRTVPRRRGGGASASFHCAHAPRFTRSSAQQARHFIMRLLRAGHGSARPLNCCSKDFPLQSTLQRFRRGTTKDRLQVSNRSLLSV
jgi:hypothetical protein